MNKNGANGVQDGISNPYHVALFSLGNIAAHQKCKEELVRLGIK